MTASIHPDVLGQLLAAKTVSVPAGVLAQSCKKFGDGVVKPGTVKPAVKPIDRLTAIMTHVGQRRLKFAQLRWDRLDFRSLPALVFYGGEWVFAPPGQGGTVRLTRPGGTQVSLPPEALGAAPVLWLEKQVKARENQRLKSRAASLLFRELFLDKRWVVDVAVATVVINVLSIAASLFAKQVYDRVVPSFAYATLTTLTAGMLIVVCLDWALKFIRARITDDLGREVDKALSRRLFDHVMSLRLDTRPRSLGTLAAQMKGLEQVRGFFSSSVIFIFTDLPFCFFFIFIIYVLGGKVAYVYAGLLPVALVFAWIAQFRLRRLARKEIRKGLERHGLLVEAIAGTETIQATGSTWRFSGRWGQLTDIISDYGFESRGITGTALITTGTLSTLGYVGAMVIGVTCMEAGDLTTGGMIACAILGSRVIGPVSMGVRFVVQWQHVRESLDLVNQLFGMEKIRDQEEERLFPGHLDDSLMLEGVRFSYPNSPMVCVDIPERSFSAGDRVVILGPNGCGKSTLLKLMAGLYRPSEGQIRLGGVNIFDLDPRVVTGHVGYLPQDVHLFKGTLATNLALGGNISDADLVEVARLLGIDRIAAQDPRSMALDISEGGQGLSGGQRQLTALARLFLAKPRLWLLDEPSAPLDMESENQVLAALRQRVRPVDIVIIASHRPRFMSLANRVIVMGRGRVLKDGTPEEVLKPSREQGPQVIKAMRRS